MKKEFKFTYEQFNSAEELSKEFQNVLKHAEDAVNTAYAPYSNFKVGAALLLQDGTIIQGSNQENKAYPSGLCAERVALFHYGAQAKRQGIKAIAIAGGGEMVNTKEYFTPCGSCRQVMAEYSDLQDKPFSILLKNSDGTITVFDSIDQLLPFIFGRKRT